MLRAERYDQILTLLDKAPYDRTTVVCNADCCPMMMTL